MLREHDRPEARHEFELQVPEEHSPGPQQSDEAPHASPETLHVVPPPATMHAVANAKIASAAMLEYTRFETVFIATRSSPVRHDAIPAEHVAVVSRPKCRRVVKHGSRLAVSIERG